MGEMPESPSSVDCEIEVYKDLFGGGVDKVLVHCDVCRSFDRAPRVPIAGTPNEKLQVDFLFSDDLVASHLIAFLPSMRY